MNQTFTDSRGVEYSATITTNSSRRRHEWDNEKAREKGHQTQSVTIRRVGPRPVDIKRSDRLRKRELKAAIALAA